MRILHWGVMILVWWSGGLLLSSLITCRKVAVLVAADGTIAAIDPPCPKLSYKCWVGSALAIAYGVVLVLSMGWKLPMPIAPLAGSVALSAIVGASVARILCPRPG
jgi:hypothetical protein